MSAEAIALKWVLPSVAGTSSGLGILAVAVSASASTNFERYGVLGILGFLFSGLLIWVTKRLSSQLDAQTEATKADAAASLEMAKQLGETNRELRGLRADAQAGQAHHAEAARQMTELRGDVKELAREQREQTQILKAWQEQ